ncbi:exonuclease SbcCD subunit D C-terminal domain-containing protein [Actinomycetaceae bacterium TAE3-ERU4]|nr:exonuclease SbcCD subunit D C-terminal domain-containing protein [Actinomycetaceae bacterium TAE3-ERU4]
MRIFHTSDWHIGRNLHGADLSHLHRHFFDFLLDQVKKRTPDALVISGDIFDRSVPSASSLELAQNALENLCQETTVILSPGNHDSAQRLGFCSHLLGNKLKIWAHEDQIGKPVELALPEGSLLIYPLPYLEPDNWRLSLYDGQGTESYDFLGNKCLERSHHEVLGAALRRIREDLLARRKAIKQEIPAVIMAHAFVTGSNPTDSERDISVGGVDDVSAQVLTTLGLPNEEEVPGIYYALGHLHRPQIVAKNPLIRYSGSPLAFSFSEAGYQKQIFEIEISSPPSEFRVTPIDIPVLQPLLRLKGTLAQVIQQAKALPDPTSVFAEVTIQDIKRPPHLLEQVREVLPNALVIVHDSPAANLPINPLSAQTQQAPTEILSDFITQMSGVEPTPSELKLLQKVYEQARDRGNK